MTQKTALVTGSAGFVGRHMTRYLRNVGWEVLDFDVTNGAGEDALEVFRVCDKVFDLVVHAAAAGPNRVAIDRTRANFAYNVQLDSALFTWAMDTQQRHVVYLSSSAAYPVKYQTDPSSMMTLSENLIKLDSADEPDSWYGWTKLTGERLAVVAREAGVPVTVVRPFSGYGEDQSLDFPFRAFINRAVHRLDPFEIWGNANQVRDWIHISDVVRGIMALVDADAQSQHHAVNLCTGMGTSMSQLASLIRVLIRERYDSTYMPRLHVDETAPLGVLNRVGDPTLFTQFYEPRVSLVSGIERALRAHERV